MKKIFLLIAVAFLLQPVVKADNNDRLAREGYTPSKSCHELSLNFVELGVAQMPYTNNWDNPDNSLNIGIGVNYTYWFSRPFGFTTGLRFVYTEQDESMKGSDYYTNGPLNIYRNGVPRNVNVNLTAQANEVIEKTTLSFLELPLEFTYQYRNLFCNLGVSLMLPLTVHGDYEYKVAGYEITRVNDLGVNFDPGLDYTVKQNVKDDFSPNKLRKLYFLLTAELGYRFQLNRENAITLSVFGRLDPTEHELDVDHRNAFDLNRGNVNTHAPMKCGMVEGYNFWSAGIRIAYSIGL